MSTSITRRYHFEAAHWLPKVADNHKCHRMHGHNYLVDVTVAGEVKDDGFLIDFWDLDKIVQPLIEQIDHRILNDIHGLENPTAEHIARWFLERIDISTGIRVFETRDCWADVQKTSQYV